MGDKWKAGSKITHEHLIIWRLWQCSLFDHNFLIQYIIEWFKCHWKANERYYNFHIVPFPNLDNKIVKIRIEQRLSLGLQFQNFEMAMLQLESSYHDSTFCVIVIRDLNCQEDVQPYFGCVLNPRIHLRNRRSIRGTDHYSV